MNESSSPIDFSQPQQLPKTAIKVLRASLAVGGIWIPIVPAFTAGLIMEANDVSNWLTWVLVIVIPLILGYLLWIIVWPRLYWKHLRYWLNDNGLHIQRGVLWRSLTIVPLNRVQHTDVAQGPLQRRYQLAKLVVHTAGTRDSSVSLSGVEHDRAEALRDRLVDASDSDAV